MIRRSPLICFFAAMALLPSPAPAEEPESLPIFSHILSSTSSPVLGNGAFGLTLQPPGEGGTFLNARAVGEHWIIPRATTEHSTRASLFDLRVHLEPLDVSRPPLPDFLGGAAYRYGQGAVTNTFIAGDAVLAATVTVAPTRNLFILSGWSNFPLRLRASLTLPDEPLTAPPIFTATHAAGVEGDYFVLGRALPKQESYGAGLVVQGGDVIPATASLGWIAEVPAVQRWRLMAYVAPAIEPLPLLSTTLAEGRLLGASSEARLKSERLRFWEEFWSQSRLDLSESRAPLAAALELAWVRLNHGLAVHAQGGFPPADSGLGPQRIGGRFWNTALWPIYRGWIQSGRAANIRCLGYPLFLEGTKDDGTASPVLGSEADPYGNSAPLGPAFDQALKELGLVAEEHPWEEVGRLFSTIPLLLSTPPFRGDLEARATAVYRFLMENGDRAATALAGLDPAAHSTTPLAPHLVLAVQTALETADRIQIDPAKRALWRQTLDEALAAHPNLEGRGAYTLLSRLVLDEEALDAESFLEDLEQRGWSPEGLIRNLQGEPSVLATGAALARLVRLLVTESGEGVTLLPGLPLDGDWTVTLERITLLSGFELSSLSVRSGVLGSFLLRSHEGGVFRLNLPHGWTSAQVAQIGEEQRLVPVQSVEDGSPAQEAGAVEFETGAGMDYLVGPVW